MRRWSVQLLICISVFCIVFYQKEAKAIEHPKVSIDLSIGPTWFIGGGLGEYTQRGQLFTMKGAIGWPYFGLQVGLGRGGSLTTQQGPPYDHLLSIYYFQVGFAFWFKFWLLSLHFDPSYRRFGIYSNSLIRYLGNEISYDSAGGDFELRFHLSRLHLGLKTTGYYIFQANSTLISLEVVAGIKF